MRTKQPESKKVMVKNFSSIIFTALALTCFWFLPGFASEDNNNEPGLFDEDIYFSDETETKIKLSGYYKNLFSYYRTHNWLEDGKTKTEPKDLVNDLNRIRLSLEYIPNKAFKFYSDLDSEMIVSNHISSQQFRNSVKNSRYNDLFQAGSGKKLGSDLHGRLNLHRCYGKWNSQSFTVTIGRQLARYGTGKLWNPLDILNPISPTAFEGPDNQAGIDAVKVEYYPSESSELSLIYQPRRTNNEFNMDTFTGKNINGLARYRTTFGEEELAVITGRAGRKNLLGIDLVTIVHDGILRGSIMAADPDHGSAFFSANAGYDYTFTNGLYCLVEYFFNGNALSENETLSAAWNDNIQGLESDSIDALISNQFITLNRHYLGILFGYDITPLTRGDLFFIADMEGRSVFVSPTIAYNIKTDLDVTLTLMTGLSDDSKAVSEFKDLSDHPVILISFQYYF